MVGVGFQYIIIIINTININFHLLFFFFFMSTIDLWGFNLVLKATPLKFINKIKSKKTI